MKRTLQTIAQFFVISFMAAGLAACVPTDSVKPTQALTPLQEAYAVRDSIIIAKQALNDARSYGKISMDAYKRAWDAADEADRIVVAQIKSAHDGLVVKSEVEAAKTKVNEAKAIGGVQ